MLRKNTLEELVFGDGFVRCPQTGRPYESGIGAASKEMQTKRFLDELSPKQKAERRKNFEALVAVEPAGKA